MRLVGGETEAEGRLELCNNNRWGTVCGNEWTDNHTRVVCRNLGFSDIFGGILFQPDLMRLVCGGGLDFCQVDKFVICYNSTKLI